MKRGITITRGYDIHSIPIVRIEKRRGRLTLEEVCDLLRTEDRGEWWGHYQREPSELHSSRNVAPARCSPDVSIFSMVIFPERMALVKDTTATSPCFTVTVWGFSLVHSYRLPSGSNSSTV